MSAGARPREHAPCFTPLRPGQHDGKRRRACRRAPLAALCRRSNCQGERRSGCTRAREQQTGRGGASSAPFRKRARERSSAEPCCAYQRRLLQQQRSAPRHCWSPPCAPRSSCCAAVACALQQRQRANPSESRRFAARSRASLALRFRKQLRIAQDPMPSARKRGQPLRSSAQGGQKDFYGRIAPPQGHKARALVLFLHAKLSAVAGSRCLRRKRACLRLHRSARTLVPALPEALYGPAALLMTLLPLLRPPPTSRPPPPPAAVQAAAIPAALRARKRQRAAWRATF